MDSRRVEVVYCDDIRNEVGNKLSLIGVYPGDLMVNALPVVLPKLCAWVNVITPIESPFSELRIRVVRDDVELLDSGNLFENGAPAVLNTDGRRHATVVHLAVAMSPFQIEGESVLRVIAEADGKNLNGRPLRIKKRGPVADCAP